MSSHMSSHPPGDMSYDEALAVLARRGPGRMVPDLERITQLAGLLGDPQLAYPSVHVTGTNGKTSVTRTVATLLSAAGLSAGTYTSPHLQTVRERFSVTGRWIGEQAFAELVQQVAPIAEIVDQGSDDDVTYFELLTAMAYWWFADKPVDVAVVEVGMGGSWDATNLVRGDVAVLTTIDVDHHELGTTVTDVAREKSGIVKEGSVVVLGRQPDEALAVVRARAAEVGAEVREWGAAHDLLDQRLAVGGQYLTIRVGDRVVHDVVLPLFGAHQAENAVVALAAVAGFLGDAFDRMSDDLLRDGFLAVTSPGRLEVVHRDPTVILDGAHNPHGARAVAAAVPASFDFRHVVLVIGCLDDKDVAGIVAPFRDVANHVVVTRAPSPRSASLDRMREAAEQVWAGTGVVVEVAADVASAMELAVGVAGQGDAVLVTGSLYTVGAARDVFLPVTSSGDDIVVEEPAELSEEEEEAEFQRALDRMLEGLDGSGEDGADGEDGA